MEVTTEEDSIASEVAIDLIHSLGGNGERHGDHVQTLVMMGVVAHLRATKGEDIDVYNELPAPFGQRWANLHDKMENFIVDAIEGGVNEEDLRATMLSDIDQLIANHGMTLENKRDQFNRRWFPEVATVPAIGKRSTCIDCDKEVIWAFDPQRNAGWSTAIDGVSVTPDFLCRDGSADVAKLHTA